MGLNNEELPDELHQKCLDQINISLALHRPEVKAAAINFVNAIGDGGVVIWQQALCALREMSFESGCECSIPHNFNINSSPSIKFTRNFLDPIVKIKNALMFRCTIRGPCARNVANTNCIAAKSSEAKRIAPLITIIAEYATS